MAGGKYAAMDVLIDVALQSESIVGVCGNIVCISRSSKFHNVLKYSCMHVRERKRGREGERERGRERGREQYVYLYVYIYFSYILLY